jgi:hypothetical protein
MMNDAEQEKKFINSITPDVMKSLTTSGFFEALDDVLCPRDASQAPGVCQANYANSEAILSERGFDESDRADIFNVMKARGSSCDCEILFNAVEFSRLKANYWRARASGGQPSVPHHGSDTL